MCCTLLLFLVAWSRSLLSRQSSLTWSATSTAARPAARYPWLPWACWGAALGGLAYMAAVAIALAVGWAVYADASFWCIGSVGRPPLGVPYEFIESRWIARSLLFVAISAALLLVAVARALKNTDDPPQAGRGLVLAGAGTAWLVLSLADHHGFGLYALRLRGWSHWLVHGVGIALMLAGLLRLHRLADQYCNRTATSA